MGYSDFDGWGVSERINDLLNRNLGFKKYMGDFVSDEYKNDEDSYATLVLSGGNTSYEGLCSFDDDNPFVTRNFQTLFLVKYYPKIKVNTERPEKFIDLCRQEHFYDRDTDDSFILDAIKNHSEYKEDGNNMILSESFLQTNVIYDPTCNTSYFFLLPNRDIFFD